MDIYWIYICNICWKGQKRKHLGEICDLHNFNICCNSRFCFCQIKITKTWGVTIKKNCNSDIESSNRTQMSFVRKKWLSKHRPATKWYQEFNIYRCFIWDYRRRYIKLLHIHSMVYLAPEGDLCFQVILYLIYQMQIVINYTFYVNYS